MLSHSDPLRRPPQVPPNTPTGTPPPARVTPHTQPSPGPGSPHSGTRHCPPSRILRNRPTPPRTPKPAPASPRAPPVPDPSAANTLIPTQAAPRPGHPRELRYSPRRCPLPRPAALPAGLGCPRQLPDNRGPGGTVPPCPPPGLGSALAPGSHCRRRPGRPSASPIRLMGLAPAPRPGAGARCGRGRTPLRPQVPAWAPVAVSRAVGPPRVTGGGIRAGTPGLGARPLPRVPWCCVTPLVPAVSRGAEAQRAPSAEVGARGAGAFICGRPVAVPAAGSPRL